MQRQPLRNWLRVLRIPNLFTVPAEPVAAFYMASSASLRDSVTLAWTLAAILCIYAAGLIWNDVFDRRRDAQARLLRPIAMGLISPRVAASVAWLLAGCGSLLAWHVGVVPFAMSIALIASVLAYDRFFKKISVLGVVTMGLCRGLSFLMGAAAAATGLSFSVRIWIAAAIVTTYVATVTELARRERYPHNPSLEVWGPATATLLGLLFFIPFIHEWTWPYSLLIFFVLALPVAAGAHLHGFRTTRNLPRTLECKERIVRVLPPWVGYLIAHLLWLSMFFILSAGITIDTLTVCAILLACWLINRVLARWFYAS